MKKTGIGVLACLLLCLQGQAQLKVEDHRPLFVLKNDAIITAPEEGVWSVATGWENDWMTEWIHATPTEVEQYDEWTILKGEIVLPHGVLYMRDAYREEKPGLIKCVRRFEWKGEKTLSPLTLSVRLRVKGKEMSVFMPGILYYGNKNGARVNPDIIPVYTGKAGEFAIFEDHRYPMPFVMLENREDQYAAAIHFTPSPVRGALLADQWWSAGVEAGDGYTDFVLYSGPIGYNKKHSVAKALQLTPMKYTNTYLSMEPGRIIEKEFYIELYSIDREGSGFQQPVYTSLDLHKPYDAERFPDFNTILASKYRFARSRWVDYGNNAAGYGMYDLQNRKDMVMGWCGQAESPGYALQVLADRINDEDLPAKVQQSLDFLASFPVNRENGMFPVGFNGKEFYGGDHVSCGQALYNFAKAIETAQKNKRYNTEKWEAFLTSACDGQVKRILNPAWDPHSTAEGFYMAPLAIASVLFGKKEYRQASEKIAAIYADRHLAMDGCYWGGTLDATCEDKEGAWAAFQGFLELYERFKEDKYLDWAKHAMDVCLSYVVVWDIPLPAGRLADFHFKSTGWSVVSPQNQHIDVYAVLFAPEVYKMGKYLDDDRLKQLARVMYRSCFQLTDMYGSQGEQLQQTNFAQRGDMSNVHNLRGGYAEGWTVFWITAHFLNAAARFVELQVIP